MRLKHDDEDAINQLGIDSPRHKRKQQDVLRNKGMLLANMKHILKKESTKHVGRRSKQTRHVVCNSCNAFVSSKYLASHKCPVNTNNRKSGISLETICGEEEDVYDKNVPQRYRTDEAGNLCRNDPMLRIIGRDSYAKSKFKKQKEQEIRKTTMNGNRTIAKLFIVMKKQEAKHGKKINILDMFDRRQYSALERAIDTLTYNENTRKMANGARVEIGYGLKVAAKALKKHFIMKDEERADIISKFIDYLSLCWTDTFGPSEQENNIHRAIELRKPTQLPEKEHVQHLNMFLKAKLDEFQTDEELDKHSFIALRRLVGTKLVLLNGRRGSEPGLLTLERLEDALNDVWIDKNALTNVTDIKEIAILKLFKVAFTYGKKNSSEVDLLIPAEDCKYLQALSDPKNRKNAGVNEKNIFVLANTENSLDHATGYNEAAEVCSQAGLDENLTATNNRHRLCTLFGQSYRDDHTEQLFANHMGHSVATQKKRYRCPPVIQTIISVGEFLLDANSTGE